MALCCVNRDARSMRVSLRLLKTTSQTSLKISLNCSRVIALRLGWLRKLPGYGARRDCGLLGVRLFWVHSASNPSSSAIWRWRQRHGYVVTRLSVRLRSLTP